MLRSAVHPGPTMAVGVSSRVVVKSADSAHHDKSGFVLAEEEQKGEVRVRVAVRGQAVRTWHPRLYEMLTNGSTAEVEEIVVPRWTLKRHLLSVCDELRPLDRVRVLGGLSAGLVGRVRAVDRSENDPEVTMWVVDGGEREIKVTMSEVRREFMRGDLVQVVAGPSMGKRGIIVGRAEAGALEIYTGVTAEATPSDVSTAERGTQAQTRRTQVLRGDLSNADLESVKEGKASASEIEELLKTTSGTVAEGELAMAEIEDIALKAMVRVLQDHVGFEQGEQRVGGWTLPASTSSESRAEAMCAADKRRQEKEKKAMMGGKLFRGIQVTIVWPHAMKGRKGTILDNHWAKGAGGVMTLVLAVRIEATNKLVQVPEEQLRHRWTYLRLQEAAYVTPWAGPLQLGFPDDEEEWEKRRTPEWEPPPTTPEWEGGRTPMPDEWRVSGGEVATATTVTNAVAAAVAAAAAARAARAAAPIGEDEGRWLCIPGLAGKRVDVRVRLKTAGSRVTDRQISTAGQLGFIELRDCPTGKCTEQDDAGVSRAAGNGKADRAAMADAVDVSIAKVQGRVVIIGPDVDGKREHAGDYAETWPNTPDMGNTVWVRFERVEGAKVEWRKYPVESLCRALNEDGAFTHKSRF
ncbi:hypothetical protein B0H16DRAFT_1794024 [Mycena metata]|uniref:KOW domain-containing protein n=1 Tax=Mycena metata TaxID=1033252 RepID=A0AAD7MJ74_9AGAR|nr:hypothetical protein B0H16DRAFT_1794024 [Mycena metata]